MVLFTDEQQINPLFPHHLVQEVVGDSAPVKISLKKVEGYLFLFLSFRMFLKAVHLPEPGM